MPDESACHVTIFKTRCNIVLVFVVTHCHTLLLQFCVHFYPSNSRDSAVGIATGAKSFFLLQNVRPGSGAHPASCSMDTGVKHPWREFYRSSARGVEVMSERSYNCLLPPYAFIPWVGLFLIFHVRATFRSHSVAIRLLCSVKLLSFRFLPAAPPCPHIQPPHHSTLQPPLVTRPTMLHLFIVITMEDTFLSSTTWQVSLSFFILLSRIPTLVVHMHTTKACTGEEVQRHIFLRSALD